MAGVADNEADARMMAIKVGGVARVMRMTARSGSRQRGSGGMHDGRR
jgi:hypothetical protein